MCVPALYTPVLISFASRMLIEMTMRPYKTALTLHSKTFTADELVEWSMRQPEVRDQCDALFLGNELLTRGVFLPLSYGAKDSLFWTPILKPGSVGGGAQPRHADSSHPPRVELHFIACPLLVP